MFSIPRAYTGHFTFSHHVLFASSGLVQFLRLSLTLMILTILRSTDQVIFWRISILLGLSNVFSWLGVMGFEEEDCRVEVSLLAHYLATWLKINDVILDHFPEMVLSRFPHCKITFSSISTVLVEASHCV